MKLKESKIKLMTYMDWLCTIQCNNSILKLIKSSVKFKYWKFWRESKLKEEGGNNECDLTVKMLF